MKTSTNSTLSIGNVVAKVRALFKFALLDPVIFILPIARMVIEETKRRRAWIDPAFYSCITNRDDIRVVCDVGANAGNVTLAAARSVPNAHIHSFGPARATYQMPCENIKNYSERITL